MDFAKEQLKKFGWKEGQGLGKREDGIIKPIKPKLKFDTAGLGHDYGGEFTNNWWNQLYNNASQNIKVRIKDDNVNFETVSNEPLNNNSILTNTGFIKTSKLTSDGVEIKNEIDDSTKPKKFEELTDEELFAACGGRTAHKAARHGLKCNGKLSRIEKQEKILLKKMKSPAADEETIIKKLNKLHLQKDNTPEQINTLTMHQIKKKRKSCKKSVSFNETVLAYHIPKDDDTESPDNKSDSSNIEAADNVDIIFPRDLSKAEKKKLKKKRKQEGKYTATAKFLDTCKEEPMDEVGKLNFDCKKRKLSSNENRDSDRKRCQSETVIVECLKEKKNKKKRNKGKIKKDKEGDIEVKLFDVFGNSYGDM